MWAQSRLFLCSFFIFSLLGIFSGVGSVEAHDGSHLIDFPSVSAYRAFNCHTFLSGDYDNSGGSISVSIPSFNLSYDNGSYRDFLSHVSSSVTCHCGTIFSIFPSISLRENMVYQSGYWVWSYTSFFIGSSISFASHDCVVVVGDPNDEDGDGDCDHCGEDVTVGEHGSGHCYGFCDLCGEHVSVGQHGEGICVNVPEYPVLCEYCGEDVSVGEHSVGVCVIDTCNWCGGDLAEGEHGHGVCDVEPPVPCEWCGGNSSEGQHGDGVCNVIPPVVCPWCGGDPSVGAHGFRHGECSHECEVCEWCGGDVSVGQHGDGVCNVHPIPLCEWCKGDPTVGEHGDGVCNKGVEDPPTLPPVPELPEIHLIPPDFEPEEKVERMTFDKFSGLVGERFGSLKEKFHDKFGKGFDELDPRGYAATDVRFQIPWFQGGFVLNVSVREIFAQYRLLFDLLRMIMLALLGIFFVYSATKICFRIL